MFLKVKNCKFSLKENLIMNSNHHDSFENSQTKRQICRERIYYIYIKLRTHSNNRKYVARFKKS